MTSYTYTRRNFPTSFRMAPYTCNNKSCDEAVPNIGRKNAQDAPKTISCPRCDGQMTRDVYAMVVSR